MPSQDDLLLKEAFEQKPMTRATFLRRVLTWGANQLLASALTLLGVTVLMLQYDWRLCLAVSLVIPPLAAATGHFHKFGMKAYRELRAQSSRLTGAIAENIAGVRVAQAFAREQENLVRFQQLQGAYFDRFLAVARIFSRLTGGLAHRLAITGWLGG